MDRLVRRTSAGKFCTSDDIPTVYRIRLVAGKHSALLAEYEAIGSETCFRIDSGERSQPLRRPSIRSRHGRVR